MDSRSLGDHAYVQAKIAAAAVHWKTLVGGVLTIALLMSGFFWLGYWVSELNIQVDGTTLTVLPTPRELPDPREQLRRNAEEKKKLPPRTKAAPAAPRDDVRWVNL